MNSKSLGGKPRSRLLWILLLYTKQNLLIQRTHCVFVQKIKDQKYFHCHSLLQYLFMHHYKHLMRKVLHTQKFRYGLLLKTSISTIFYLNSAFLIMCHKQQPFIITFTFKKCTSCVACLNILTKQILCNHVRWLISFVRYNAYLSRAYHI